MQCIADSWHSPIRSTAISVLIGFLQEHLDLYPTDSDRQEFAAWYLDKFCFVYKQANGDDKSVCVRWMYNWLTDLFIEVQRNTQRPADPPNFWCPLDCCGWCKGDRWNCQPKLLSQEAHRGAWSHCSSSKDYYTCKGHTKILSQVEHALTLVRDKIITIATIDAAQGKCPMLPKPGNLLLLHSMMMARVIFPGLSPRLWQRLHGPLISLKRLKTLWRHFLGAPLKL